MTDIFDEVMQYMPDGVVVEHGLQVNGEQSCTGVLMSFDCLNDPCFFSVDELRKMADEAERLARNP